MFIWKHQPTLWWEQRAGKLKLLSGLTSRWFTYEIHCDRLLFSSYVALYFRGQPSVGRGEGAQTWKHFHCQRHLYGTLPAMISFPPSSSRGKHWHNQTQNTLLTFVTATGANGSRGMEKMALEEALRVLRGRDHSGGRVPEDRQQTWPSPSTFWTHALVLYCCI